MNASAASAQSETRGPLGKILVAEDNRAMLQAISVRLESMGYTVVRAEDAYQAYAAALHEHPDVLVLDINLPAGDGFSIQSRLAQCGQFDADSVIYITGASPDEIAPRAAELGVREVLYKPFCTADLACAVRDAIEHRAGAERQGVDQAPGEDS